MSGARADAAREALCALRPGLRVDEVLRLGRGHIHDTFVARAAGPDGAARFVVQGLNAAVFRDPEALAANLERVAAHLERALRGRGVPDPQRRHLRALAGPGGQTLHRDADGGWWRAFPFLEHTVAFDTLDSPARAREAARAFGAFLADLADLAPGSLRETIPGFHDLGGRVAALEDAVRRDPAGRAAAVGAELDAARRRAERALAEDDASALPVRVVHNDCKLNNLLFDASSGEALCVVDLDTVMAGRALFDFGELVRTGACPAAEDERDLARVRFDRALFHALAQGYVAGARGLLASDEIRALARAGPRMALENAIRFLTDHLEGDRYFRIARAGHNLDRARAQLCLVAGMDEAEKEVRQRLEALAAP